VAPLSPLGFLLRGESNDSYMCSSSSRIHLADAPDLPVCESCGYRTDFEYTSKSFRVNRRIYDFSATYDGACIVSLKSKEFCLRRDLVALK